MWKRMLCFVGAAAVAVLSLAGAANAANKQVFMGAPPADQKKFDKTSTVANAFFPRTITIHRGDAVSFVPAGFHTVDFPSGGQPLPPFSPTGGKVTSSDAAGIPFWFNGLAELGLSKPLLISGFGKTFTKGKTRIESGLPLGSNPEPTNARFPKN